MNGFRVAGIFVCGCYFFGANRKGEVSVSVRHSRFGSLVGDSR